MHRVKENGTEPRLEHPMPHAALYQCVWCKSPDRVAMMTLVGFCCGECFAQMMHGKKGFRA